MDRTEPQFNQSVQEVLKEWPQSASVFTELKTACIGCYLARFCTLKEVAATYDLQAPALLKKLIETIQLQTKGVTDETH
jgi:hybrid cluster-associated redox disulfide protein